MTDELKSETAAADEQEENKVETASEIAADQPEDAAIETAESADFADADDVEAAESADSAEVAADEYDEDDDDHRKIVLIEKKEKNRTLATSEEYENFVPKFSEDNMPQLDSELRASGIIGDDDNQSAADIAFAERKAAAQKKAADAAAAEAALTDADSAAVNGAQEIIVARTAKPQKASAASPEQPAEETHVDNSAGDEVSPYDKLLWQRTAVRRCRQEIGPLKRSATVWYALCMMITFIVILYIFTLFSRAGQDFGVFFTMIGGPKNLILLLAFLFLIYFVRGKNRKLHIKEAEYEKLCRKLLKKLDSYIEEQNETEKFKEKFIKETVDKYKIDLRPLMIENADLQRTSILDRFKKK